VTWDSGAVTAVGIAFLAVPALWFAHRVLHWSTDVRVWWQAREVVRVSDVDAELAQLCEDTGCDHGDDLMRLADEVFEDGDL
jgi:hypothetical protein